MKLKRHRITHITIGAGGSTDDIDAIHLEPDHWSIFLVSNEDPAKHKYELSLDPVNDVVLKSTMTGPGTGTKANPLTTTAVQKVVLDSGEMDMIRVKVQPRGNFGTAALPYTSYKYTFRLIDKTTSTTLAPIDPDWDIAPPN